MASTTVNLKNPVKAAFLAWLIPGLGHFYQGRTGKGILYLVCILGLYLVGLFVGDAKVVYWVWMNPMHDPEHFRFSYFCQFWVGLCTLPALIQGTLAHYDMHTILWGFLAKPPDNVINGLYHPFGKQLEVGWVYTVIAGLLNVLAIYDAYDGPFYEDEDAEVPAVVVPTNLEGMKLEGQA